MRKDEVLKKISPDEALIILRKLIKTDEDLKTKVVELAEDLFRDVDIDQICEE